MPYSPIRVAQIDLVGLSGYINSVMVGGSAVLTTNDQLSISGRKGFLGTIDFTGNVSTSGGINFNRTNYQLNQYGQFEVGANGFISSDPYVAQLYDLSNTAAISLDWNGRQLSGQWSTNSIPSSSGHLVNYSYLRSGDYGINPYLANTTGAQTLSGVKTFAAAPVIPSGASMSNISLFSSTYQDGDTIFETNSGNNISWSKAQLQNGATAYLNWTGSQLTGANWKCDNFSPSDPAHIVNLSYLTGGGINFNGTNTFTGISLVGGNGVTLAGNLAITQSGSYLYLGSFNVFDPNAAQLSDFSNAISIDYSNRLLSGQWQTNTAPASANDLINYSYFNANIPSPVGFVATTGNQNISGNKTFLGQTSFSGVTAPTLATGNATSGVATTQFVQNQIAVTPYGMKNRIINGYPLIDQRNSGASQTITAAAALAYTVDRWYAYCTGANITGQQVQVSGLYRYKFTGAASNTAVGFGQRIEARNCADLAGTTATLSVKLSSSSLTSITWTAYYANTTDTFGTLASPTRTSTGTGTFTITSTEAPYSAQIAVSASATTGIEIVFTGGALLASQTLIIGDVQLEAGSVATSFDRRDIESEQARCQRYAYQMSGVSAILCTGLSYSTISANGAIPLPVSMRTTPTVTISGPTDFSVTNGGGSGIATTTASVFTLSPFSIELSLTVASGLTAGQASLIRTGVGGTAKILINAEL